MTGAVSISNAVLLENDFVNWFVFFTKDDITKSNAVFIGITLPSSHSGVYLNTELSEFTISFQTKNTSPTIIEIIDGEWIPANNKSKAFIMNQFIKGITDIGGYLDLINTFIMIEGANSFISKDYLLLFDSESEYKSFYIPKHNGSYRKIFMPNAKLFLAQKAIQIVLDELYIPSDNVHGFVRNRNLATNAQKHVGKSFVLNCDLKDFFENCSPKNLDIGLATLPIVNKDKNYLALFSIIKAICFKSIDGKVGLPQGSPSSPVLSNICFNRIDLAIEPLAAKYNMAFSRYADDLTFSGTTNMDFAVETFIHDLRRVLFSFGFDLNDKKIKFQSYQFRQMVTGVVVNRKLNVHKKVLKETEFYFHMIRKHGIQVAQDYFSSKTNRKTNLIHYLYGKIGFIEQIRGDNNTKTLAWRLELAFIRYSLNSADLFHCLKNRYTKLLIAGMVEEELARQISRGFEVDKKRAVYWTSKKFMKVVAFNTVRIDFEEWSSIKIWAEKQAWSFLLSQ